MSAEGFFRELLAEADIAIDGERPWDLQVRDARAYERILKDGSIGFGEAFMEGWLDCARVDQMAERAYRADLAGRIDRKTALFEAFKARLNPFGARGRSFEIGAHHYDAGNDLFEIMLDRRMIYSCGYWLRAEDIEQAQRDKLELVCRKLQLEPGMRLLDIGCGWGGLAAYAAERFGVSVVGVTVSREQLELGRERCRGLPVELRYQDYRDLDEPFERIVSVGMFEHVGRAHYPAFFAACARCLVPQGLLLLHTVGYPQEDVINPWYDKYVMPGVEFPTVANIADVLPAALRLEHFHTLEGAHYDRTLMAWFERFDGGWDRLAGRYGETFRRMWKLYLQGCAGAFRTEQMRVWQLVLSAGPLPGGYRFGHQVALD
ncbi:cyclopropane fatty acyl phospholipid synthase [Marinimicrococcus flavescens]|uniref:Cyclopropane fatty acyl phospholipid synthase n=1 Tax=Marinimicrococcus flavescens TaxID=3031815 RepID=A0AAP4D6Q4_9PROT|nr:cyclopropane fatty acyl phospholipid synthase [Marinimicrococcus flavescens]